ncbi:transcription initiation factor TFIIE subunit alpha, partial [Lecanoromycetidae sp. Uapishka_2]
MDLAKTLIRTVARGFYETKHVLVIDALMIHSAVVNEDLAYLLGMQQKDLRKLCGKLRDDRMLSVHARPEIREGQQRPVNKDYYYVDYHAAIDAIKYRVFHLTESVKKMYTPSEEKKDYECKTCKAEWTELEVLDKVGPQGFECHRCGAVLHMKEAEAGASTGHQKQSRLMSQLGELLRLLQRVDAEDIPGNDFQRAYDNRVPVPRDDTYNPGPRATVPIGGPNGPPTAVKGMTQITLEPLKVSVTATSDATAEELAAEAERKAKLARQNALPDWHIRSTVTGEALVTAGKESDHQVNGTLFSKDEEEAKKDNIALNDELTAYYAQLAKEKEQEAKEEREADESSGDDDEEDFEDVGIEGSGAGTPSSSTSTPHNRQVNGNGNGRLKASESGSSAATPADTGLTADDDGPVAKKVKFETRGKETLETAGIGGSEALRAGSTDKDSDEDEEADFEDAL